MTFQQIINIIEKRPSMLVGEKNIIYIYHYISGFFAGKNENSLTEEEQKFINNFQEWIYDTYKPARETTWANILLFYEGSHENAIKKFNSLYKKFEKE